MTKGFTLIELLVVISLIVLLTALILPNYRAGDQQLALQRSVHKLAQDLRQAQEMAVSSKEFESTIPSGYGIFLDKNVPGQYILFADLNSDQRYTAGTDGLVETISLESGVEIIDLYPLFTGDTLTISFVPPDPQVVISGGTEGTITLAPTSDLEIRQSVTINAVGLISVGKQIFDECDSAVDCDDNNVCTTDTCERELDSDSVCHNDPVANGTDCGDCYECQSGVCNYLCQGTVASCECIGDICKACSDYGEDCGEAGCPDEKKPVWSCVGGGCVSNCVSDIACLSSIFYETFPNRDFAWNGSADTGQDEPGWVTYQGSWDTNDVQVSNEDRGYSPSGGNHLTLEDCDQGFQTPETYDMAYVSVNLAGHTGVAIEYYWQSDDVDSNEGMRVAYSIDSTNGRDGTWTQIAEYLNPTDDVWNKETFYLPDGAAVPNFKLRFSSKSSNTGEHMYVDDIRIAGTFSDVPNQPPTIISVSDVPDPVNTGNDITFTVYWSDINPGDQTKIHICQTDAISGQSCLGGSWCDTTSWDATSPSGCNYTTQSGDIGDNNYYAFVCDDDNTCSSSQSGTFTVEIGPITIFEDNFEAGLGNWSNIGGDNLDWTRRSGSTPSSYTGPSSAHEGSYYIYTEASWPNYPNKRAYLEGPEFNASLYSTLKIDFWYHMYGSHMGSLYLDVYDGSWNNDVWSLSGDQGNQWFYQEVDISSFSGNIKLRFRGITGSSYRSDMALDDIEITGTAQ